MNESNQAIHKKFAADCFNKTWDMIDLETRTAAQDDEMLALAMASYWHWTQRDDFTPKNASISAWQISRVHALRGEGEMALKFGKKAVDVILDPKELPFFVAYGWEAQARAAVILDDMENAANCLANAQSLLPAIPEKSRATIQIDLDEISSMVQVAKA